jgi:hypothetical protein
MIRFSSEQGVKKWFTGWLLTASMRLNRNEHCIDFRQLFRVIDLQDPSPV